MDTDGTDNFGKFPKTRALRGLSEITVSICIHLYPPPLAPNRPSTEKGGKFFRLFQVIMRPRGNWAKSLV
jgi:hypothetical protein